MQANKLISCDIVMTFSTLPAGKLLPYIEKWGPNAKCLFVHNEPDLLVCAQWCARFINPSVILLVLIDEDYRFLLLSLLHFSVCSVSPMSFLFLSFLFFLLSLSVVQICMCVHDASILALSCTCLCFFVCDCYLGASELLESNLDTRTDISCLHLDSTFYRQKRVPIAKSIQVQE